MYLHVSKIPGVLTDKYPPWMGFLKRTSDPLFCFYSKLFHQGNTARWKISSEIENASLSIADICYPSFLYTIPNDPPITGVFQGDGNEVVQYVNDEDFFSPIPSRIAHVESISLDTEEPELFAVCYVDCPSGEFYAIGHSGIYRYDLSGTILLRSTYNLDMTSEELEFTDRLAILSHVPASGSLFIYDRYDLAHEPLDQFILSGKYVYATHLSGTYVAEYDYLLYDDGAKLGTSEPLWDGYVDGGKIFMGKGFDTGAVSIPFEFDATPEHVRLIVDPRHIRPGRDATIEFSHDVHTITAWADSHVDSCISTLSGESFLEESLRVYTTGDNGTAPLFFKDWNIYRDEVIGATAIYLEDVATETSPTLLRILSGEYTAGTFYVSSFSRYTETYTISGEASYEAAYFLQAPTYEEQYELDEGYVWPKTVFSVQEPLSHIREQMSYAQKDRFSVRYADTYGGICKRHPSGDIWVISQQLNAYQNRVNGPEFYINSSAYEADVVYLFADAETEGWGRCYLLSGVYTLTDPGGGTEKYFREYPLVNFYSDPFAVIGFMSCGKYLLTALYKNEVLDLVYHDPGMATVVDSPDVVEYAHALSDPKDSFLFNERLYVLAQNTLEVFQLYFDYRITHGGVWLFRELYDTLEVTS